MGWGPVRGHCASRAAERRKAIEDPPPLRGAGDFGGSGCLHPGRMCLLRAEAISDQRDAIADPTALAKFAGH
eukprot:931665-Alexandrium_andersonii.AAC.1